MANRKRVTKLKSLRQKFCRHMGSTKRLAGEDVDVDELYDKVSSFADKLSSQEVDRAWSKLSPKERQAARFENTMHDDPGMYSKADIRKNDIAWYLQVYTPKCK